MGETHGIAARFSTIENIAVAPLKPTLNKPYEIGCFFLFLPSSLLPVLLFKVMNFKVRCKTKEQIYNNKINRLLYYILFHKSLNFTI